MIRPAWMGDINKIVAMIQEDCEEMDYPFNKDYVTEQITEMIKMQCLLFVEEKNNNLIGLLGLLITPNLFDPRILEMREFIWYASIGLSDFGRARVMVDLLDFMIFTAKEKKMQVYIALPEVKKTESIKDLLVRRNFNINETSYMWRF